MIPVRSSSLVPAPAPSSDSSEWADALLGYWIEWREEATAAAAAYALWTRSAGERAVLAFAAYRAALEREEAASAAYERVVRLAAEAV